MADEIRYLPVNLATLLGMVKNDIAEKGYTDGDAGWRLSRLVERAYAEGHHEGYLRGMKDQMDEAGRERRQQRASTDAEAAR